MNAQSKVRAVPTARAAGLRPQPPAASSQSSIPTATDVNLSEIMEREGIQKIERVIHRYSVLLKDGRLGMGASVGEALAKAKLPDALNVRRAA